MYLKFVIAVFDSVVDFISAMYNKKQIISREARERKTALVFLLTCIFVDERRFSPCFIFLNLIDTQNQKHRIF